jgi:hypothetical protein
MVGRARGASIGAEWSGGSGDAPPEPLDAAIRFAPDGALVPAALRAVAPGGTVVCGGIHMSEIPRSPTSCSGRSAPCDRSRTSRAPTARRFSRSRRRPGSHAAHPLPARSGRRSTRRLARGRPHRRRPSSRPDAQARISVALFIDLRSTPSAPTARGGRGTRGRGVRAPTVHAARAVASRGQRSGAGGAETGRVPLLMASRVDVLHLDGLGCHRRLLGAGVPRYARDAVLSSGSHRAGPRGTPQRWACRVAGLDRAPAGAAARRVEGRGR